MSCSRGPKLLFCFCKERKLFLSPHPQNSVMDSSRIDINYQINISSGISNMFENNDLINGLLCLQDREMLNGKEESMLKICNPSTGQTLMLSKLKSSSNLLWHLFGYDPIDKQFKVLVMTQPGRHFVECENYQVLTLGFGNLSWRIIDCCVPPHDYPYRKICINGVLYYISRDLVTNNRTLVCFDVRFEKLNSIQLMGTLRKEMLNANYELINYNDKLGLVPCKCEDGAGYVLCDGTSITFKVWVLEDFEKNEWCDHTFLFSNVPKNVDEVLKFIGMTKKREIVLSSIYSDFCLFYLNLEKKTMVRVNIEGVDQNDVYDIFLDYVENVELYASV